MRLVIYVLLSTLSITFGALLMSDVYELARWCNKQPEINGTEDDVNELLMGYLPETKHGMCMLWCMEVQAGILVNNTFDVKGTYKFFRNSFPECPYYRNIERGVWFCARLIAKRATEKMHHCQYAHMVAACIKRRIKYVPGCKAAFYRSFVWKNNQRKVTMKPARKYFEPKGRPPPEPEFEIITRAPKNYTLRDLEGLILSSEGEEDGPYMYLPPRMRKGKRRRFEKTDRRDKKGRKRKEGEESGDDSDLDRSDKRRRHQKKARI